MLLRIPTAVCCVWRTLDSHRTMRHHNAFRMLCHRIPYNMPLVLVTSLLSSILLQTWRMARVEMLLGMICWKNTIQNPLNWQIREVTQRKKKGWSILIRNLVRLYWYCLVSIDGKMTWGFFFDWKWRLLIFNWHPIFHCYSIWAQNDYVDIQIKMCFYGFMIENWTHRFKIGLSSIDSKLICIFDYCIDVAYAMKGTASYSYSATNVYLSLE